MWWREVYCKMRENLKIANSRSGLNKMTILFGVSLSFVLIGVFVSINTDNQTIKQIILIIVILFLVISTILFCWSVTIRDKILKTLDKNGE